MGAQLRLSVTMKKSIKDVSIVFGLLTKKSGAHSLGTRPNCNKRLIKAELRNRVLKDQKMVMLYISHADDTEHQARILRVKQRIAENEMASSLRITKITNQLDKGKGHVFQYSNVMKPTHGESSFSLIPVSSANKDLSKAGSSESSSNVSEFSETT
ncbi:hypothetical protein Bca101_049341 [Brassica carinata]